MSITFVGDEDQLVLAMAQSDLNLAVYPGTGWQLSLAAGTRAQPAPTPVNAPAPAPAPAPEPAPGTAPPTVGGADAPSIPAAE
jgi:hypothetical protein